MVTELESFPESWGSKSTVLFLNDFLLFEQDSNKDAPELSEETTELDVWNSTEARFDTDDLPFFLQWPEYDYWKGFVKLNTQQ